MRFMLMRSRARRVGLFVLTLFFMGCQTVDLNDDKGRRDDTATGDTNGDDGGIKDTTSEAPSETPTDTADWTGPASLHGLGPDM